MSEGNGAARRLCPTRPDGAHAFITHWISPDVCFSRQRSHFHKCYSCEYRGLAAHVILPAPPRHEAPEPEVPEPVVPPRPAAKSTAKPAVKSTKAS